MVGEPPVNDSDPKFPQGTDEDSSVPGRQHAWGDYLFTNQQNQVVFPQHQVFVFLQYRGENDPTDSDRKPIEEAFRTVERAFQRGAGTEGRASVIDGLLFTIGYSRTYFDRFDEDLPQSTGLLRPETVLDRIGEDPQLADPYDAVIHLGSDKAEIVLGAEEALFGSISTINGTDVSGTLGEAFERVERRSGVIGTGTAADRLDFEELSPKSPLPMGFNSAFEDTLPSEDRVTIESGPFSGGTTQHISRLEEDLDKWWMDQDHDDRVQKMFAPDFSTDRIGEAGERLGSISTLTEDVTKQVPNSIETHGRVGHLQKVARARDDNFEPIVLRRGDFFESLSDQTELHFGSLQRHVEDIITTLEAMHDVGFEEDALPELAPNEDGILEFIETKARGTYLIPPRDKRALPTPQPV